MLMGDLFMRRQEPVKAVFEYKEAADLNLITSIKRPLFFREKS